MRADKAHYYPCNAVDYSVGVLTDYPGRMLSSLFVGSLVNHHSGSQLILARILPQIPVGDDGNAIPYFFRCPFVLADQGLELPGRGASF
jgi:hypothetical protein